MQLLVMWLKALLIILQTTVVRAEESDYCYFSTLERGQYALQTKKSDLEFDYCDGFYLNLPLCNATKRSTGVMTELLANICSVNKIWALNDSAIFNISLDVDLQCLVDLWCRPYVINMRVLFLSLGIITGVCFFCICGCKKLSDDGYNIGMSRIKNYISRNTQGLFSRFRTPEMKMSAWKPEEKDAKYFSNDDNSLFY